MKFWIFALVGLAVSWYFIDVNSESFIHNKGMPIVFLSLIATMFIRLLVDMNIIKLRVEFDSKSKGGLGIFGGGDHGNDV